MKVPTREVAGDPWFLVLLLALTMAIGVMPSFAFGPLAPFVLDEFDLNLATLGLLTTSFNVGTAVMSRAAGRAVDRFGARNLTVMMSLGTALASAMIWRATTVWWLLLASLVAGCAYAIANPATNVSIATLFSRKRKPVALGIKQAGVSVGSLLAGVALPPIALSLGWRGAVGVLAVAAVAIATSIWIWLPETDRLPTPEVAEPHQRSMIVLAIYAFFTASGTSSFLAYLAVYLRDEAGFTITAAGLAYGLAGGIAIAGRVFWGWGFDPVLSSRSWAGLLLIAAVGMVVSILILLAPTAAFLAWVAVLLLGTCVLSWSALFAVAVSSLAGESRPATATGLAYVGFYSGLAVSPPLFGAIVDATGGFTSAWIMTSACFLAAAFFAVKVRPYEAAASNLAPAPEP